jgi:ABC-type multidrug transport system permease subunit
MRAKIDDGEAHHGLVIEGGFGAALERGELPELVMLRDPGRVMEDQITRIGLAQAFMAVTHGNAWPHSLARILGKSGMDEQQVAMAEGFARSIQGLIQSFAMGSGDRTASGEKTASDAAPMSFDMSSFMEEMVPVRTEDLQPPERPKQLSYQLAQSVCGIMVMMVMFLLMACGATLIQERENGTLPRIMASAIPRSSLLLGKSMLGVTIGFVQLLILCAYGQIVFQVDMFRDIPTLLVISLSWTAAATSFGMLIASWAQTTKQAEGLSTLLILLMAAIGGCWFPVQVFDLPLVAQIVTRCSLAYWAMTAYQGMLWHQRPWFDSQILGSLGVLWGFAVAASLLAYRLFKLRYLKG